MLKMAIREATEPVFLPNKIKSQQEAENNLWIVVAYFLCQVITTCSKLLALAHHFEAQEKIYMAIQIYYWLTSRS